MSGGLALLLRPSAGVTPAYLLFSPCVSLVWMLVVFTLSVLLLSLLVSSLCNVAVLGLGWRCCSYSGGI